MGRRPQTAESNDCGAKRLSRSRRRLLPPAPPVYVHEIGPWQRSRCTYTPGNRSSEMRTCGTMGVFDKRLPLGPGPAPMPWRGLEGRFLGPGPAHPCVFPVSAGASRISRRLPCCPHANIRVAGLIMLYMPAPCFGHIRFLLAPACMIKSSLHQPLYRPAPAVIQTCTAHGADLRRQRAFLLIC